MPVGQAFLELVLVDRRQPALLVEPVESRWSPLVQPLLHSFSNLQRMQHYRISTVANLGYAISLRSRKWVKSLTLFRFSVWK